LPVGTKSATAIRGAACTTPLDTIAAPASLLNSARRVVDALPAPSQPALLRPPLSRHSGVPLTCHFAPPQKSDQIRRCLMSNISGSLNTSWLPPFVQLRVF
jgi:hypothetical protein